MPMERSVSCAERGSTYGAGAVDLRSYSASYARPQPPARAPSGVQRARSLSSWTRPAPPPPVQRAGSTKSGAASAAAAGRPTPGLNLRSYSASYAASYGPTLADTGGGGQLRRSGSVTNWTSANRRSVNLRGYAPSFAALDDTAAAAVPAPRKLQAAADDAELQRRRRLVVYKTYDVEGKVRESVRRGVSWIKGKCSGAVYGWW